MIDLLIGIAALVLGFVGGVAATKSAARREVDRRLSRARLLARLERITLGQGGH